MKFLPVLAIGALLTMTGCGASQEEQFREEYISSCVGQSMALGSLGEERSIAVCNCLADKHIEAVGPTNDIPSEIAIPINDLCMATTRDLAQD